MDLHNTSQEEFEKIEAYITGQLSKKDVVLFERQLIEDSTFKLKVDDIKAILTGIESQALKEQLEDFHLEISSEQTANEKDTVKVRTIQWKRILVAAALVIAAGSFWFLNGNSNERLYAKYFTPDPGLPTVMSSSDDYEFYDAMVNYKQGDYKTAIFKWKKLQKSNPRNDTINYFIGVAHLANKKEIEAIKFLEKATEDDNFSLINDANFYLGLAYLKTGDSNKAKVSLQKANTDNSNALLSDLKD